MLLLHGEHAGTCFEVTVKAQKGAQSLYERDLKMTKHKKKAKLERTRGWEESDTINAALSSYWETAESSSRSLKTSFASELTAMLYAYGDVRHPLPETVALVQEIVHGQLCELFKACAEVAALRSNPSIDLEEILFLLRRNEAKLSRFVRRMKFLDDHAKLAAASAQSEGDMEMLEKQKENRSAKRWNICSDFLTYIDESGELHRAITHPIEDESKVKRLERAEQQTRDMDADEYMEYVKCRQVSFSKEKKKFSEWIDLEQLEIDAVPTWYAWEALEYLAQETVSELVDYALLVRSEELAPLLPCETEPDARHMPVYASSSFVDRAEILSSSTATDVKEEPSAGEGGSKKAKAVATKLNRKLALTPAHIREAMRRFKEQNAKTFLAKTVTLSKEETAPKLLCLV